MTIILTPKDAAIDVFEVVGETRELLGTLVQTSVEWADIKVDHADGTKLRFLWGGRDELTGRSDIMSAIAEFTQNEIWNYVINGKVVSTSSEDRQFHVEQLENSVYRIANNRGDSVVLDDGEWFPSERTGVWALALVACRTCSGNLPRPVFTQLVKHTMVVSDGQTLGALIKPFYDAYLRYRDAQPTDDRLKEILTGFGNFPAPQESEQHEHYVVDIAAGDIELNQGVVGDAITVTMTLGGKLVFEVTPDYLMALGRKMYACESTDNDEIYAMGAMVRAMRETVQEWGVFELDEITPENFSHDDLERVVRKALGNTVEYDVPSRYTDYQERLLQTAVINRGNHPGNNAWIAVMMHVYLLKPFADREVLVRTAVEMLSTLDDYLSDEWQKRLPELLSTVIRSW